MEKTGTETYARPNFLPVDLAPSDKMPGHHNFRDRYASGFEVPDTESPTMNENGKGSSTPLGGR